MSDGRSFAKNGAEMLKVRLIAAFIGAAFLFGCSMGESEPGGDSGGLQADSRVLSERRFAAVRIAWPECQPRRELYWSGVLLAWNGSAESAECFSSGDLPAHSVLAGVFRSEAELMNLLSVLPWGSPLRWVEIEPTGMPGARWTLRSQEDGYWPTSGEDWYAGSPVAGDLGEQVPANPAALAAKQRFWVCIPPPAIADMGVAFIIPKYRSSLPIARGGHTYIRVTTEVEELCGVLARPGLLRSMAYNDCEASDGWWELE